MVNSTYNFLKRIENEPTFLILLQKGIISLSILDKMVYYERYLMELKTVSNAQAIANASEEYNCHEATIRRAIKAMEN